MSAETALKLHLPIFEGPFDLLLHLIRENQVDIYDIPIAEITAQYLGYLKAMEALDLEVASSFLVMAATLLAIKAKTLLPPTEDEGADGEIEDAREGLVQDLLEYIRYKEAASLLQQLREQSSLQHSRPNVEEWYTHLFAPENPLDGKTLDDLTLAFGAVLRKMADNPEVMDISREQITIRQKSEDILEALAQQPRGLPFSRIFHSCRNKMECVTAFLALLELMRQALIRVGQSGIYDEIYIYAK